MKTLCDEVIVDPTLVQQEMDANLTEPGPMCERLEHPNMENAVAQYCKRFNTWMIKEQSLFQAKLLKKTYARVGG